MKPKVLLVDDVLMFIELQKFFLKNSSVNVLTAGDGVEALRIARVEKPSLIFMDLNMPNMDGVECCARIKADPELRHIPVVMITTEGKEEERERCRGCGCDGFMTKPIDRVPYLETARKFLPTVDRRESRLPFRKKVKFRVFGLTLCGETIDISRNGVFIASDHEIAVETSVELVFSLDDGGESVVRAKGRVAWVNGRGEKIKNSFPAGFGVELLAVTDESQRAMSNFIQSSIAH